MRSGLAHPDSVVETVSLSSVSSPEISYHMLIPEEVVDMGQISALQLEAAVYACQAHEKRLPSGERLGYLIGSFFLFLNFYCYRLLSNFDILKIKQSIVN